LFHVERFSASDICKIIQALKKYKVSRFSGFGFTIEFSPEPEIIEKEVLKDLHIQTPETSLQKSKESQREKYQDLLEEARLADPAFYEELVGREEELDEETA